jgi:hypothetical protein
MRRNKRIKFFRYRGPLDKLIEEYFENTLSNSKPKEHTALSPTIAGLALHIGFNSKDEFEEYERRGRFKAVVIQARLKIISYYESRLHYPSPTGAIFALKSMGWTDKPKAVAKAPRKVKSITVKLVETGPKPASSEKEVQL